MVERDTIDRGSGESRGLMRAARSFLGRAASFVISIAVVSLIVWPVSGALQRLNEGLSWAGVGETIVLGAPLPGKPSSGESAVLPATRADGAEVRRLWRAGDELGLNMMVTAGRAVVVAPGTQARIIERSVFTSLWTCCEFEVRIMTGRNVGRTGWINSNDVDRQR